MPVAGDRREHSPILMEARRVSPRPFAESPEFRRLVAGEHPVSLARIALEIAADAYPDLDVEALPGAHRRAGRAGPAALPAPPRCGKSSGRSTGSCSSRRSFRGDHEEYYDPRNSYLNEVLDRRLGIPISLSVLYWAVAEPAGPGGRRGRTCRRTSCCGSRTGARTWSSSTRSTRGPSSSREMCRRRLSEMLRQPVELDDGHARALRRRDGRRRGCSATSRRSTCARRTSPRPCRSSAGWRRSTRSTPTSCATSACSACGPIAPARRSTRSGPTSTASPSDDRAPEIATLLATAQRRLAEWN